MISMIRSAPAIPTVDGMDELAAPAPDGRPIWIHLPIAEAERLSPSLAMPRYCETLRCQTKQRRATTFHALISVAGEADCVWAACAECTELMLEGAHAP